MKNIFVWIRNNIYLLLILLYTPSLGNYFSSDDWFHLRISNVHSIPEFLNFFSFVHTAQSAAFYRPISTQVFFFIFQRLFGLTAWPYYLFVLLCFGYSLYLIYHFAQSQFKDKTKALAATFIYGISVSNFTRLYFLSAFQEISLVIFSLLCLLSFPKSKLKSVLFFIFALLSKETAVVLPILILLFNFKEIRKHFKKFFPYLVISLLYLLLRFKLFGFVEGDSYVWNFSPSKLVNTFMWYSLWSFGAPELLVDYIGTGLKPIARFYTDYPYWWLLIISLLLGTITSCLFLVLNKIKKIDIKLLQFIFFFLITLAPVIFLPQHKFALELGLPLVGFSYVIAWFLPEKKSILKYLFLLFFIVLNLSMNYLTYTRHYSVNRSITSRQIVNYFLNRYPYYPQGRYFEFVNDTENYGQEWGSSKQISNITSGSELFKVIYSNNALKVYFQDYPEVKPTNEMPQEISTNQFFQ